MAKLTFIQSNGQAQEVVGKVGENVMVIARRNNVPGILAECGGCATCATCHVYVASDWAHVVDKSGEIEADMLEFVQNYGKSSRLGCQLILTGALDGLVVHVPEQHA